MVLSPGCAACSASWTALVIGVLCGTEQGKEFANEYLAEPCPNVCCCFSDADDRCEKSCFGEWCGDGPDVEGDSDGGNADVEQDEE